MADSRKRVFVSVISDLVTDQRVHRTSLALFHKGLNVTLVGRRLNSSLEMKAREYHVKRFRLLFEKGPFFYLFYNLRLFFFLLFKKTDVLVANDLDTLPANFLVSKIKGATLYYDSHEYFTGVPELAHRHTTRKIWKLMERCLLPRLKHIYTVNESIADLYRKEYGVNPSVVRNLPFRQNDLERKKSRADLKIPTDKKLLLFQGAGINIQRGAEEILESMQYLDDCVLVFIGSGDVIQTLKKEAVSLNLSQSVFFFPKMPLDELRQYTVLADLGLSLDKDTNINYRFSLPNKLFDYIQAGVPVLASNLPEIKKVVEKYQIGMLLNSHDPREIANVIRDFFSDADRLASWKENLKFAAQELCWENEESRLFKIFEDVI
ncbi:MAG: glycosyltransferase [Bacteroidetes bacterium]|nr:MAG: glycosyltransferase [Bacteroidota bacterium]